MTYQISIYHSSRCTHLYIPPGRNLHSPRISSLGTICGPAPFFNQKVWSFRNVHLRCYYRCATFQCPSDGGSVLVWAFPRMPVGTGGPGAWVPHILRVDNISNVNYSIKMAFPVLQFRKFPRRRTPEPFPSPREVTPGGPPLR